MLTDESALPESWPCTVFACPATTVTMLVVVICSGSGKISSVLYSLMVFVSLYAKKGSSQHDGLSTIVLWCRPISSHFCLYAHMIVWRGWPKLAVVIDEDPDLILDMNDHIGF